eukprot:NODE_6485_length_625_cov_79.875000_g5529_i0.p2 GENE.NODE_6485_length_625_cov_79.875000_g5529_i0~~NODE_6485_length_625_cov_79.875000_g5529_i0.p2  ORF type:complete len:134 (-),score=40.62 NODE_6485_length_625_cov_79.875000_g5529_i0:91-492(-)
MSKRPSKKSPKKGDDAGAREIGPEELAKHNTAEDCWMAIGGKVYDVTTFLPEHPGGADVMVDVAGKEATEEFNAIGHSPKAKEMMEEYLIGTYTGPSGATSGSASEGGAGRVVIFAMIVFGLAFAAYMVMNKQ